VQRILTGSYWWNRFLPITLILAGAGITAIVLAADLLDFGGARGIGPRQASLALSGFAVFLAGVVLISSVRRRYISEWLLIGLATIAVVFAADLLVINGLPEVWAKHFVLVSVGLSILTIGVSTSSSEGRGNAGLWLDLLTLDKLQIRKFLSTVVQLGLLVFVVRLFHLENQAFYHNLMLVTFYGFLIHYFLPSHYRLPFFLLLSLATSAGILGFVNSIWLISIGLGLIGICHLPISYSARVVILLVAGAALIALRAGWIQASWLDVIWPVLASMFMFRLIIYMYDLKHGRAKSTITSTLSYFFLLPNIVFPFFPVVDYSTFRRTYYNDDQHQIYQTGIEWMLRGVIHLILYRYINYYLMIAPGDVSNILELGTLSDFQFWPIPQDFRTISPDYWHFAPVWFQPAGNTSPVLHGLQFHRFMAPDQYLLERFHVKGVLLSHVLQNPAVGSQHQPGICDCFCIFSNLVISCLSMVLAPGNIPANRARYVVLVDSGMFGDSQYTL